MIKTTKSLNELQTALAADFITDKKPLRDYAGFEAGSIVAGQMRQTFSLTLSAKAVQEIKDQIGVLYQQLIAACWRSGEPLPFDMIRFDAFLDSESNEIKIIELNTRNVGMHEIVEWLDDVVGVRTSSTKQFSLNRRFAQNQKLLHANLFGANTPLLYLSALAIPRWLYYEALADEYSSVDFAGDPKSVATIDTGVVFDSKLYQAVARKYAWPSTPELVALDDANVIRVLQPLSMRKFGHKSYLQELTSPTLLGSETFTAANLEQYIENQDKLVLKVIDSGNSKSVYLGGSCSADEWQSYLNVAAEKPHRWILQDYIAPSNHLIIMHGGKPQEARIQLGVFVLPKVDAPNEFDIDIAVKAYVGDQQQFTFDPSGLNPDIWFGHVVELG
jgi:hypothetical protein